MDFLQILFYSGSLLFLVSRRPEKKDVVTEQPIRGIVFNTCTDSGLAGVTVFLQTFEDGKTLVQQKQTVSGAEGRFEFLDVDIHSDNKFTYALHIPSKSGAAAQKHEDCAFTGATMVFFKDEIDLEFKPRVTPAFLRCCIQVSSLQKIVAPDSLSVLFEQRRSHKNVPDMPYNNWYGPYYTGTSPSCAWGNSSMGLSHLKIEKWKNGNYSLKHDSIYLGMNSVNSYTVEW